MRIFISIDIPEEVKKEIKKIQDELPNFIGKKTEVKNLHLTLKFLGEIDEEKIMRVREKLKEIKFQKFEVEIDSIGLFSPKFIKIVWLHVTNCDNLQKQIDGKLKNLFEEERSFMSHLTIARIKAIANRNKFLEEIKKIDIPKIKFIVEKFKLKKSILERQGPKYETIEEYNLK